ncbi:MAG: hypothetical protein LBC71_08745 [Oscillospiraceae bacterium]|jgi:hypothetical protein|nr:hypothetical protein [Oscillospiraceae bacterium]
MNIKVDTTVLQKHADDLRWINLQLNGLDGRIKRLYKSVNLLGLFNLIRADLLVGENKKITRAESYLHDTANDFERLERNLNDSYTNSKNGFSFTGTRNTGVSRIVSNTKLKSVVSTFFTNAKNVGKKAVIATKNVVSAIKDEIGPGGRFEGVLKAVVTTTKIISAATLVAVSVATLPVNPMAVLGIIYGVNALIGAGADLYHIDKGNYEKVGDSNILKTGLKTMGGAVGTGVGASVGYIVGGAEGAKTGATIGKSAGSMIGSIVYTAGEIYTTASVGKTVIAGSKTVSELTKPRTYETLKDVIKGVDAISKGEFASFAAGKIVDEYVGDYINKNTEPGDINSMYNELLKKSGEKVAEEAVKAHTNKQAT